MKSKQFILTLLALFVSINASSYEWTDANGTIWSFVTSGSNAVLYKGQYTPCISGTVPKILAIPSILYDGETPYAVTYIGDYAFSDCSSLTSITIPDAVTYIGAGAFARCSSLTSITIPDAVTYIGESAFLSCSSLTSINIPDGVTSIKFYTFSDCSSLTSITIPASVTHIDDGAFDNTSITFVSTSIPPCTLGFMYQSVRFIVPHATIDAYREAWPDYTNQIVDANHINKTVEVSAKDGSSAVAEAIGEDILINVLNLKVKGTINSYDLMVFRNKMTNLMDLDLSESNVVACPSYSYYDNYKSKDNVITGYFAPPQIVTLKLPKDITKLEENTFKGCESLITVELPEGIPSIPAGTFNTCYALKTLIIPESVTSIGQEAFSFCNNLTHLRLPKGLRSIGNNAFFSCGFTEIHLPPYLESIDDCAFKWCNSLKSIYAYMTNIIAIGTNTFEDYQHQNLYVPEFLYNNYWYDTNWSQFLSVNKTSLSPDDYEMVPTNSDIVFADGDERIPDTSNGEHVDGEIDTQGSFTVEGNEPQPFDDVDQIVDPDNGQGGSLIGEDDGETQGNLDVNHLRVNIRVKAGRWYFFIFPYDVTIANVEYPGQYAWLYYDGAQRASTGQTGWKTVESDKLLALHGYAFQSAKDGTMVVTFNKPSFGGNRLLELIAYAADNMQHASWNLVGNPFSSFYNLMIDTFGSPITRWNPTTNTYTACRPGDDDCHLQPYEAIFVQKPNGVDEINFQAICRESYRKSQEKTAAHALARRAKGIDPQRRLINLQILDDEQETDQTRVVLNNEAKHNYEMECDASKFMSESANAQLYSIENGIQMAINERPFEGDIRLGYTAKKAGRLGISAPRMDLPMVLVDTKLNVTFDLTLGTYEFDTEAGTFNGRFMLCQGSEATAINRLTEKTGVCIGTQDGGLSIGGAEGKSVSVYNIGGAEVANQSGNGFIALKSGIYVIKVDGESVKMRVK